MTAGIGTLYNLTTNIPASDPAFYGYNFTRWTLRVMYNGTLANGGTGAVAQTLEVLVDTAPPTDTGHSRSTSHPPTRPRPC